MGYAGFAPKQTVGTRLNRLFDAVLTGTHNLCFEAKIRNTCIPVNPVFLYKVRGISQAMRTLSCSVKKTWNQNCACSSFLQITIFPSAFFKRNVLITIIIGRYRSVLTLTSVATFILNIYEPVHEKTNNFGFRPGPAQTGLCSHTRKLEAWNFAYK